MIGTGKYKIITISLCPKSFHHFRIGVTCLSMKVNEYLRLILDQEIKNNNKDKIMFCTKLNHELMSPSLIREHDVS